MYSETYDETISGISKLIQETAIEIAWKQWVSLGAGAFLEPARRAKSIIDPEALLLLSLVVQDAERRLADFSAWWAEVGASLLSVQRTKTMLRRFPEPASTGLKVFSRLALEAGDRRWKEYASDEESKWEVRRNKGAERPLLSDDSTLLLRLRAGFGVNAKADALSFLLGIGGGSATVQDIASAIGYSTVTTRNALKDMVLSRLIHETPDHPARYYVFLEPWAKVLDLQARGDKEPPTWAYWYLIHAFLANAYVVFQTIEKNEQNAYLLSSKARDLVDQFGGDFTKNRIPIPAHRRYRGTEYLGAFAQILQSLRKWIESCG